MLTQHYKLPATLEHIQNARPGGFVHAQDGDEPVIGFIDFVSDVSICIMLFEPTDLPLEKWDATNIAAECDFKTRLSEILRDDPEAREMWLETLKANQ